MLYAVILVAWLAMMPQLMPKQRTDYFDWAMLTLLPDATLVFCLGKWRGVTLAQLRACLTLVHAQGHEGNGRKPRGFWSVRKVRGTLSVSSMMKRKHHSCMSLNFSSFPHLKGEPVLWIMGKASIV